MLELNLNRVGKRGPRSGALHQPVCYWNQNIPEELGQYQVRWCPGSLRRQLISITMHYNLLRARISTTCVILVLNNDRKCIYIYIYIYIYILRFASEFSTTRVRECCNVCHIHVDVIMIRIVYKPWVVGVTTTTSVCINSVAFAAWYNPDPDRCTLQ